MKLTVNGVDIEIEGAAEVVVDGDKVKIKTLEPSQPCFVPSPFWVEPAWRPPSYPYSWTVTSCVPERDMTSLNLMESGG